jgi:hypothetical protein
MFKFRFSKKLVALLSVAILLPTIATITPTPTPSASALGYRKANVNYFNRAHNWQGTHYFMTALTADVYFNGKTAWALGVSLACQSYPWSCRYESSSYWDPYQKRLHIWGNIHLDRQTSQSLGIGYGGLGVNFGSSDNQHIDIFLREWVTAKGSTSTYAGP